MFWKFREQQAFGSGISTFPLDSLILMSDYEEDSSSDEDAVLYPNLFGVGSNDAGTIVYLRKSC